MNTTFRDILDGDSHTRDNSFCANNDETNKGFQRRFVTLLDLLPVCSSTPAVERAGAPQKLLEIGWLVTLREPLQNTQHLNGG